MRRRGTPHVVLAQYAGTCARCGGDIEPGVRIRLHAIRGRKWEHAVDGECLRSLAEELLYRHVAEARKVPLWPWLVELAAAGEITWAAAHYTVALEDQQDEDDRLALA